MSLRDSAIDELKKALTDVETKYNNSRKAFEGAITNHYKTLLNDKKYNDLISKDTKDKIKDIITRYTIQQLCKDKLNYENNEALLKALADLVPHEAIPTTTLKPSSPQTEEQQDDGVPLWAQPLPAGAKKPLTPTEEVAKARQEALAAQDDGVPLWAQPLPAGAKKPLTPTEEVAKARQEALAAQDDGVPLWAQPLPAGAKKPIEEVPPPEKPTPVQPQPKAKAAPPPQKRPTGVFGDLVSGIKTSAKQHAAAKTSPTGSPKKRLNPLEAALQKTGQSIVKESGEYKDRPIQSQTTAAQKEVSMLPPGMVIL